MNALEPFLRSRYVAGGRGPVDFDCWGLVRSARQALFGGPLLPECADAKPGALPAITRSVARVAGEHGMRTDRPSPGMIATGWHGKVCAHVGLVVLVDGALRILETDKPTGPCLTRLSHFEDRYSKVAYYAD